VEISEESPRNKRISDGKFEDVTRQPEQIQAFRDAWNLGVHSYLTYLRDRFRIAGDMLTQSGSIFVQIGAANVHLIRCILDESFGAANCCSLIAYRTSVPLTSPGIAGVTDYLLWYARSRDVYKYHALFIDRETGEKSRYTNVELPDGTRRPLTTQERDDTSRLPVGSRVYSAENLASSGYTPTCIFDFEYRGKVFRTSSGKSWKTNKIGMQGLAKADRLTDSGKTLRYVLFFDDFPGLRSQKAVILIQP